jgi:hypothetical protein
MYCCSPAAGQWDFESNGFLFQRLSRLTAFQMAVGARVSKFYLGLAQNSKLQNVLMLSDSKLPTAFQVNGFSGQRLRRFNGK